MSKTVWQSWTDEQRNAWIARTFLGVATQIAENGNLLIDGGSGWTLAKNYCHDLDAFQEIERKLSQDQRDKYMMQICTHVSRRVYEGKSQSEINVNQTSMTYLYYFTLMNVPTSVRAESLFVALGAA